MRMGRRAGTGALAALLLSLAVATAPRAEENQVNVYNWSDYIGKNTIAEFEQATGIKVVYDTFDADATVEAKVMTGGATYDVVSTANSYFGRQIKAGVYLTLDKSKLPNWKNLDPKILEAQLPFDPGNAHAMPYMFGTNGFAYDVDAIKKRMPDAPLDSLDMLFKPEIVSKFQDCGVTLLDSPQDVLQFAFAYLHLNPNSTKPEDFKAAEKLLLSIRPYIKSYDSAEYINSLVNREVCIAMSYSGDYSVAQARAKAAHVDIHLAYTVPKEGANLWVDALLIPKAAPHPEAAYKFLNFMLEPKVIAEITNELGYANCNAASLSLIDPKVLANPAIYPTPEILARLYPTLLDPTPDTERLRTRAWTRVKTGL